MTSKEVKRREEGGREERRGEEQIGEKCSDKRE